MPNRIEDYAMIGDMRTAALVGRDGSIDWFCAPRFDSDACFAALLGDADNGRWKIAPRRPAQVRRHYQNGGLILETRFSNEDGIVSIVDFMPVGEADSSIVRLVIGREGKLAMETDLVIRFDYGLSVPWVNRRDKETLTAVAGPSMLVLRTPVNLRGQDLHTVGRFTVKKGQTIPFVLTYVSSHLKPPPPCDVQEQRRRTEAFWRDWSQRCNVKGKWSGHVRRSLVTLKGLSFRPTGGIVAAPTTSLPESLGGVRNWDYRFCWVRDAAFTLLAFLNAGYTEEAEDWQNWLLRAVAGSPDQLQIMYGLAGERDLPERQLDWLAGYAGSRPVRVGNAASLQIQLDVYGELADVVKHAARGGLATAPRRGELRLAFLRHLEQIWQLPDYGIWEIRGEPQHFVHSKVMAWVAFDRAWRATDTVANKARRARWKKLAAQIHADICANGVDSARGCFVQAYGSQSLDAALLLLPIVGFLPPTDRRIKATVAEIERRLLAGGLVLRYETASGVDGLPQGEGAFLPCSFWLVDIYVLMGRRADAVKLFERLLKCRNDVGLLAEEYDPRARRMLGNFPQAFSHVALVNSALGLLHATGAVERPHLQQRHHKTAPKARQKTV
ncbi:MAG TPA: glycoside hydrolase family 15 protein [Ramlibacter sp.]|nr:glycoside hydrolase family 15 protein [Ramlibacter sp.]